MRSSRRPDEGQSLVEVLVGVGLGALFIIGVAGVIAPALKTNQQVVQVQVRAQLAKELMDNIKGWSAGNWNGVLALATGSLKTYYLSTSTSPFVAVGSGASTESVTVATNTYTRYFYLEDVYRDSSGNITTTIAGNNYDPSSKSATVIVTGLNPVATTTLPGFLTRQANNVIDQSSWVGGSGQSTPVTLTGTTYATSSNVEVTATGSIQLAVPTGGTCQL